MLVFILRDLFAFLAAGIFFLAGISTIGYALRILLASTGSSRPDSSSGYRENVQIHIEEND